MRLFFSILLIIPFFVKAQIKSRCLYVTKIHKLKSGYVIHAIDTTTCDTLRLISNHSVKGIQRNYRKVLVNRSYQFVYMDWASKMCALPPGSVTVGLDGEIVWRHNDGVKKIPVYVKNMNGIYIQDL